jgi:D-glycero-D-manno-heptose 1,7-bisphosphate phosphatase
LIQELPKLVVLDRDGTLITETGYLLEGQGFELCAGAAEAVARFNNMGIPVAVATNQSAIGRGWLSEAGLGRIHAELGRRLAEQGARVDLWLHCAEHPSEGQGVYRRESVRRKPGPGMLLEAAAHFAVRPGDCLAAGDAWRDLAAARAAGMPAWMVATGKGRDEWHRALGALGRPPDLLPDLAALAALVELGLWRPPARGPGAGPTG